MDNNQFLHQEYEESYKQLRFYDEKHSNLVKFVFTFSTTVGTILVALFQLLQNNLKVFWLAQLLICTVVFVAISIIFLGMVKNRLYFVITAKQLNAIRKYFLDNVCTGFVNNQMYLETNIPAFKLLSSQTLEILGVSFTSSLYVGTAVFSLLKYFEVEHELIYVILIAIVLIVLELIFSFEYLSTKGRLSSDKAVHGTYAD